ncbi:hypothetical protein [Phascolarctobacterium sp.]|uniref:hypothetical protein n=1 Tax=Phascolarctobacterium sp. TaxID=2049039 RepID=UPI00386D0FEF
MKTKILTLTVLFTILCSSYCLAEAQFKERFIAVSNTNENNIAEVNYYLQRGGTVVQMQPIARSGESAYCYVVVRYPADVPDYVKK